MIAVIAKSRALFESWITMNTAVPGRRDPRHRFMPFHYVGTKEDVAGRHFEAVIIIDVTSHRDQAELVALTMTRVKP